MADFRCLTVWRRAVELSRRCYRLGATMPESEKYGIRSQIARASVSIAANIAEGTGRGTAKDYRRFLRLAYASACEVQSHGLVAAANELVDPRAVSEIVDHADEVRRTLNGLMKSVTI